MSKAEAELQELLRELREKVENVRRLMRERGSSLEEGPVRAVVHMRVPPPAETDQVATEETEES